MRITTQAFWLPKAGNTDAEYEDGYWPQENLTGRAMARFRCAVTDGATETSFSALWAAQLALEYCRQPGVKPFVESLPGLQAEWRRQVFAKPLPWYAEEKVRKGAFAALLGLTIRKSRPGRKYPALWDALAIGDCCLFQIREGEVIAAFPLSRSEEFNSRPYLLGTNAVNLAHLDEHVTLLGGGCEDGDTFLLMSDALACWYVRRLEEQGSRRDPLAAVREQAVFAELTHALRPERDADGRPLIRNDDMTLLRVELAL